MSLTKDAAFDILGLPTFATSDEITLRYKYLALLWYPEKYSNSEFAVQEFSNITLATIKLLNPDNWAPRKLKLIEMYGFFQHIFFNRKRDDIDEDCSDYDEEYSENSLPFEDAIEQVIRAEDKAVELIKEEEREKEKAKKRKAKKKRRKERKKQEKQGKETEASKPVKSNTSSPSSSNKKKESERSVFEISSDSEEDLDTNSAFVSVIARKQKKNQPVPSIPIVHQTKSPQKFRPEPESPRTKAEKIRITNEIATRGNAMANVGNFDEAVNLFTECIFIDSTDHRFYNNRSYCYERLTLYEKALHDAEKAVSLDASLPKGYYRKGRAYLGLKKYVLAEESFMDVLKRDSDSEDAKEELKRARLLQLMEKGYSRAHSETALGKCDSVSKALGRLKAMGTPLVDASPAEDIYISDEESEASMSSVAAKVAVKTALPYDIKKDVRNPEQHNSLWIGNVQPDVTEKQLKTMFSKHGELISVKIMPEKFCAFINYKSKACPGKAMEAYQGYKLSGYNLEIRFPNLPGEPILKKKTEVNAPVSSDVPNRIKYKEPVNGTECYFWRTTGCMHGAACRFEHLPASKGIDKKGWMA